MNESIIVLCSTAAAIGVVHTLFGPDHYLPFVAMSRAGRWSVAKTAIVTALCGVGHVAGSIILGVIGIATGVALFKLESIEAARGDIAGWMLIAFGIAYTAWGLRRAYRNRPHTHWHVHADGTAHVHEHVHESTHAHVHAAVAGQPDTGDARKPSPAPWVLFTIFVFGPCEPLIPLLMYPAAKGSVFDVFLVVAVFGVATIGTMLATVLFADRLAEKLRVKSLERFTHVLAGATICLCGLAVKLGL